MKNRNQHVRIPVHCASLALALSLLAVPALDAALETGLFTDSQVYAQRSSEDQRPPPEARSAGTLSRQVSSIIVEVLELTDMEDYAGALDLMQDLRNQYDRDRLNDLETFTMWQFYANIAQLQEDYDQALVYYQAMLEVDNIPLDRAESAYRMVAVLYQIQENFQAALDAFLEYLDLFEDPAADIYLRVGTLYYQLENYPSALDYILQNMAVLRANGNEVPQNTYALLRSLYFNLEDYQSFRQINREMIVLFNNANDWPLLASANSQLELFAEQGQVLYVADKGGYLDSETQFMQLAFSLSNSENPYEAARVIQRGIDAGIIDDQDPDNLSYLSQFYQLAREDELAIAPLARAAEIENEPSLYIRLGRLYMNLYQFEDAIEAFDMAFDAGEVDRPDQTLLSIARAYLELNMYDEAIEAAQQAATDERSRETASSLVSALQNAKRQYDAVQSQTELYREFFLPGQYESLTN